MQDKWEFIYGTFLTLIVLVFSMVDSIYSNTLRYAETADANMYSSTIQADLYLNKDIDISKANQKIAKEWLTASELYRAQISTRAYSTIWCIISFVVFFFALMFALLKMRMIGWVFFWISFVFLVFSVITHIFNLNFSVYDELISRIQTISPVSRVWIISPNPPRWTDIQKCIDDHDWLTAHLQLTRSEIAQHRVPKQE